MRILLLFILLNNVPTLIFSMYDVKKFPYHEVVCSVTEEGVDQEEAKGKLEKLYSNKENIDPESLDGIQGPNDLCNYRTAAILSAYYSVNNSYFAADQLAILEFLLNKDSKEEFDYNKKTIIADLDEKKRELKVLERGLRQRPFEYGQVVEGGGSVIVSDDDDEDEKYIQIKLERIKKVEEILGNISIKREASNN